MGWRHFTYHFFHIFNCRCRAVTGNGRIYTFNETKIYTFVLTSMYVTSRNVAVPKYYSLFSIFTIRCRICGLMASFVQLIGIGLNNIKQVELNERNVTILGVAVLFGSGVMFYRLERSSPCRLSYNIYLEMVCS